MRKTVEKIIGGRTYQITQVGADTGDAILARIALGLGSGSLTVNDILAAKNDLRDNTKVGIVDTKGDGRTTFVPLKTVYDDLLADALGDRLEWLIAAWEVSFGPISAVREQLGGFRTALSNSFSPKTPDGSSTDSSAASA